MTSSNLTFYGMQVTVHCQISSNFLIKISTPKTPVSCSKFSQDSKYANSFLLQSVELRKIASQNMTSSIFRYILQIPFSHEALFHLRQLPFAGHCKHNSERLCVQNSVRSKVISENHQTKSIVLDLW